MCCAGVTLPVWLFRGRITCGGDEDALAVVGQLCDGVAYVAEGAVVAGLGWGCEVGLGIPAASEFFNGRDIDGAVVQVIVEQRHIAGDEVAID